MKHKALIVIDVQKGFQSPVWGSRNNLQFEENAARLIEVWRGSKRPIVHIQHLSRFAGSPLFPGQAGVEFMDFAEPRLGERIFQKHVNSSFIGTGLEAFLKENKLEEITIIGLSTDHCVSTTARMGTNLGFKVQVVHDATAAWNRLDMFGNQYDADTIHRTTLASLNGEFAELVSTDSLIEEMEGEENEHKTIFNHRTRESRGVHGG